MDILTACRIGHTTTAVFSFDRKQGIYASMNFKVQYFVLGLQGQPTNRNICIYIYIYYKNYIYIYIWYKLWKAYMSLGQTLGGCIRLP